MRSPARPADVARLRALRRLTRALDGPMAVLAVAFLGVVIADLAAPPDAPYRAWLDRAALTIWGAFVLEFLVRLAIAPDRGAFLRRGWFDLLVLAVPALRFLRVLRAFRALRAARALRFLSLFRLGSAVRRGARALGRFSALSRLGEVAAATVVVALASAAAMTFLERDVPGSRITTYGEALWWSAALVTTVGGDLQPVTGAGRALALGLMLYGMVVFGYLVTQGVAFLQGPAGADPRLPADRRPDPSRPAPALAARPAPAMVRLAPGSPRRRRAQKGRVRMMNNRITAVFDSREHAQMAIDELRSIGVTDAHLSFLSRHQDQPIGGGGGGTAVVDREAGKDVGEGVGKGLLGGAAVGALFGLAAALIPGVGPFIAAGTLATALGATGGAVAAGAIVGGTSGAIAGALSKAGYTKEESDFYGREVEQGRVVVAVEDTSGIVEQGRIREILQRHGGRTHAGWAV